MANEITTTTADDLVVSAEILASAILDHFYGHNTAGSLVRYASISGAPTKAKDFPISPGLSAGSLAEGTDMTNTAFATTKTTITAAEVGLLLTITDVLSVSDVVEDSYYAAEGGKALAAKLTTDILALGAGFSNTCGGSGLNLSEANITDGLVTLMAAGVPGPYVGILHPRQWGDMVDSAGSSITPVAGPGSQTAREASNDFGAKPDGGLGRLYGVEWYMSSLVPTANAGADRIGMIVSRANAIGQVSKWDARVEFERDASLRAREVAITAMYGVGELLDAAGVGVVTDA